MASISIRNLQKRFGATTAVSDFSLDIRDGELVTFLGPSGCGKTTTLRMIAGFIQPSSGSIHIGERDVTHLPVHRRGTGMVFQRYALFPHMTVLDNVAFGLEMHKVPADERKARIRSVLDMVRMSELGGRYPRELSGGQQQRVAIARALAIQPSVFLLDEPLSNLDAKLRVEVREEVRALQQRLGLSTVFVTHDQEEAMAISDRMAIMHDGIVQQVGTPAQLYEQPANLFVADFLGRMNFLKGRHSGPGAFATAGGASLKVRPAANGALQVGIRPERLRIAPHPLPDMANALAGTIDSLAYSGHQIEVRLRLDGGDLVSGHMLNTGDAAHAALQPGVCAHACFQAADCVLFEE